MGLSLSRNNKTVEELQQLQKATDEASARLAAVELTLNQLRSEVNTLRAGKRKLEEQVEELATHAAAAAAVAAQPTKRQRTSKLQTAVPPVADGTSSQQKKKLDSPTKSDKPGNAATKAPAPVPKEEPVAPTPPAEQPPPSAPPKEADTNDADKSPAVSLPSTKETGGAVATTRKRSARSTAGRSARSKPSAAPPGSPSTSAGVSEKPAVAGAGTGTATSEKTSMTIAQLKTWLEENGHDAEVEKLAGRNARKPEWLAVYKEKRASAEGE